jgi:Plant transposon protein
LLTGLTDGTFTSLEKEAGVVPYPIGEKTHDKLFILVDGIYPRRYSRFVRGITEPIGEIKSRFTAWQEGARKDIERAFGVLQGMWKAVASPIHKEKSDVIANLVATCILLHNMCVSERIMKDAVNVRYCPADVPQEEPEEEEDGEEAEEEEDGVDAVEVPVPVAAGAAAG